MSTNNCTFCGRLGNNPEITTLPSGKERVRFSIAVDRNYKREDGSRPTDWIPVVIWGSANYVKKTFQKETNTYLLSILKAQVRQIS